jgi:hypothetical protein
VKEQEIYGWARHDTFGLFKSVASITENNLDAVYVVVQREIQGVTAQYIERFADRQFFYGSEDAWCVDAAVQSTLTTFGFGLTASSSVGSVTFTLGGPVTSAVIGNVLRMGGGIANITGFVSPTQITGTWIQSPTEITSNDPNNTPIPADAGEWSMTPPSTVFLGLSHLEGQTVSILADGGVVAPQVVVNASITLPQPATKVVAGLAFTAQLQTMPLDIGEPTIQAKRKNISATTMRVTETRGLYIGSTFDNLVPVKEMNPTVSLGMPIPLVTDDERIIMDPSWNIYGQVCMQITDPLPATILGIINEIAVGDTK